MSEVIKDLSGCESRTVSAPLGRLLTRVALCMAIVSGSVMMAPPQNAARTM